MDAKNGFVRCVEKLFEKFSNWVNNEWAWDGGENIILKGHSENMTRANKRKTNFSGCLTQKLGRSFFVMKLSLKAGSEGMSETMNLDAFKLNFPFLMLMAFWQKTRSCFRWLPSCHEKFNILWKHFAFCDEHIFYFLRASSKNHYVFVHSSGHREIVTFAIPEVVTQSNDKLSNNLRKVWPRKLVCDLFSL